MVFRETTPGVFYNDSSMTSIRAAELDFLVTEAQKNPRQRARICAHPDIGDSVHEMVICLLKQCYIPPHHHRRAESIHVLKGVCDVVVFEPQGAIAEVITVSSQSATAVRFVRLPPTTIHTLLIRSHYFLFHETSCGPWNPSETEFPAWAPAEGSLACSEYQRQLRQRVAQYRRGSA